MFVISGTIEVDPAHHERAAELMATMGDASRAEDGCGAYEFTADLRQPGRFRIFEEWSDDEALAAHFASTHMQDFQAAAGELGGIKSDVARYDVSAKGPLARPGR
jgi:quinol monooxygenase YgiN